LVVHGEFIDEIVDRLGRDTGFDEVRHQIKRRGGQLASLPHALERLGAEQLDLAGLAAGRERFVDKGHGVPRLPKGDGERALHMAEKRDGCKAAELCKRAFRGGLGVV